MPLNAKRTFPARTHSLPVYDPVVRHRVWTHDRSKIYYSDNGLETLVEWADISSLGFMPTFGSWMSRDSAGNVYVHVCNTPWVLNDESNSSITNLGFWRIDAVTKQITKCFDPYMPTGTVHKFAHVLPWCFTEDNDGFLYAGQYGNWGQAGLGANYQYIWRSTPGGREWTRIDIFVTGMSTNTHIHSVSCNPWTNELYVAIGDLDNGVWRSIDKLQTVTKISTMKALAITHTQQANFFSQDLNTGNFVWRNVGSEALTSVWRSPQFDNPQYALLACGDNEMWVTQNHEGRAVNSSLWRLRLTGGTWAHTFVDAPHHSLGAYWLMNHSGRHIIPEGAPYVYAIFHDAAWTNPDIVRIQRVTDEELLNLSPAPSLTATAAPTGISLSWLGTATRIERRVV